MEGVYDATWGIDSVILSSTNELFCYSSCFEINSDVEYHVLCEGDGVLLQMYYKYPLIYVVGAVGVWF